jgi:hypothetical protein
MLGGAAWLLARHHPRMGPGLLRLVAALAVAQVVLLFAPAPTSAVQVVLFAAAAQLAFIAAAARIRS